jgi:hypothetical protein
LQLLDGGRPEGVACGEHDRQALVLEAPGQLADGGGLAGAVDADHQNHERPVLRVDIEWLFHRREDVHERAPEPIAQRLDVLEFLASEALLQVFDDSSRRVDADVGHHEQRFEFLERVFVDLAARREVGEVVGQPAVAPVKACTQALDESLAFCGFFLLPKHCVYKIPGD